MGFIGIHVGVGSYSQKRNFQEYEKLISTATMSGINALKNGAGALEACSKSIKKNDPLVNCGYGSNLTANGTVECDASLMCGNTMNFGGCGAVHNIKNPIELALKICNAQTNDDDSPLIQPCLLVANGATHFAEKSGMIIVHNDNLVSPNAKRIYKRYKEYMKSFRDQQKGSAEKRTNGDESHSSGEKKRKIEHSTELPVGTRMDTVGAVCIDDLGHLAAGVSSGGIVLKQGGRVGHAAIIGAGVWADRRVAVSTSGCGEHIMKTTLAKEIALNTDGDLHQALKDKYLESPLLDNITNNKIAGAIVVRVSNDNCAEFSWSHTDLHFGVGYMSTKDEDNKPTIRISTTPNQDNKVVVSY